MLSIINGTNTTALNQMQVLKASDISIPSISAQSTLENTSNSKGKAYTVNLQSKATELKQQYDEKQNKLEEQHDIRKQKLETQFRQEKQKLVQEYRQKNQQLNFSAYA